MNLKLLSVDFSPHQSRNNIQDTEEIIEESLSLSGKEMEMIKKALEKYNGKRKMLQMNSASLNGHSTEK